MIRVCSICGDSLDQCMGFQRSDDFVEWLQGTRSACAIREICGKCDIREFLRVAGVAQLEEVLVLSSDQCGFESPRPHQIKKDEQ